MTWFSKENDNYRYLLVVVDVISRFAWVLPLKDKSGDIFSRAFESIFDLGRVPKNYKRIKVENSSIKRSKILWRNIISIFSLQLTIL